MGVQDFDAIFDVLDPSRKNYLVADQIEQFYEALHFSPISKQHVQAAIKQICGPNANGQVLKEQFLEVLQELDRRRTAEEQARWDFMALDRTGSSLLPVTDALVLFRVTHGNQFSMHIWNQFLDSRERPEADVCFDEVKMMLCDIPEGDPTSGNEYLTEEERLKTRKKEENEKEYDEFRKNWDKDGHNAKERDEYEEKTRRIARRKKNRWEKEGIEALLYDDGVDTGEDLPSKLRKSLGINDLLDALEWKYEAIRKKLLWEMLRRQIGEAMWSSMSDSDQVEAFQQLQSEEKHLRKTDTLASEVSRLEGATVSHNTTLQGLMGDLEEAHSQLHNEMNEKRFALKAEGKNQDEINKQMRKLFEEKVKVPIESGELLVSLNKRFKNEKDMLMATLKSDKVNSSRQLSLSFCRLVREHVIMELEEVFATSALAVGLAERPQEGSTERVDPDRLRHEVLAGDRLQQRKGRKLKLATDDYDGAGAKQGNVDLQISLIREITYKHAAEREICIQMLQSRDGQNAKTAAHQLSQEQRTQRLTTLRNQRTAWRGSSSDYMLSQRSTHINILQEGIGVYYETVKQEGGGAGLTDEAVCATILASLQQKQDAEFDILLLNIPGKRDKELENMRSQEYQGRREEHLDNLAAIVLGTFELEDNEKPFINALNEKYEKLRNALLANCVKVELALAFERVGDDDKRRMYMAKKKEESRLRQEGQLEEMGKLVESLPADLKNLRALIGEDRNEYAQRRTAFLQQQERLAFLGQDFTTLTSDEVGGDEVKTINVLADLVQRYYAEQDALITWLRSREVKTMDERHRNLQLAVLKCETRRAEKEESFDLVALSMGLRERIQEATETRHAGDQARQEKLSQRRVQERKEKLEQGKSVSKELDEYARPEKGNLSAWEDAFLKEMEKKHVEEREILLSILQDPSLADLQDAALMMADAERQQRLAQLRNKRYALDMEKTEEREENTSILEEAAAIRTVMKRSRLQDQGKLATMDEVIILLLAELQDEQDREMAQLINRIVDMEEEELNRAREFEINSRHWKSAENAVNVLTRYEGSAEDDQLIKALEDKYDALRDKLLMEAMMKQMGEDEWKRLSEQERQQKLMQLKLKERQLKREGRYDELARLLGEGLKSDEALRKLMGENRAEHERKLKERLARRQKRIKQGLDPDDTDEEDEEDGKGGTKNILEDLNKRFEDEKDELLKRLRGINDQYLSEKERQAELVRLLREKRNAEKEGNFENAALLIGLAEKQRADAEDRLKSDRLRQEQLARERLAEMRKRRGQKGQNEDEFIVKEGDKTKLQEAVLKRLDELHSGERALLSELLDKLDEDTRRMAEAKSELERQDRQETLKHNRQQLPPEDKTTNHEILLESSSLKAESRRVTLKRKDENKNITEDEISISLVADLQDMQDREVTKVIQEMQEKNNENLITMQEDIIKQKRHQRAQNVAMVTFAPEDDGRSGDDQILDALDSKYDALRDKLISEALIAQLGESEWNRLSEQERQRRLVELKLKEKQLRRDGKHDEAAALLGDAIKNHEALEHLMGDAKAQYEQKLKERLERRRQRREQGISEEEIDKIEKEEEEEDKKRRNVLKDLQREYDKEREELLRRLAESDKHLDKERRRQLELARLKRDQRRARKEEKFDAAALLLGMAQEQEENRNRQEQLARERLAARLAQRLENRSHKRDVDQQVALPDNEDDMVAMQEALMKEIELKHQTEQDVLLQLLESEMDGDYRNQARAMTMQENQYKLEELHIVRQQLREDGKMQPQEHEQLLQEATGVKVEVMNQKVSAEGKSSTNEDHQVALLADLQQLQDKENFSLLEQIGNKDAASLRQLKQLEGQARSEKWYDNVATVLLGAETTSEEGNLSAEEQELVNELQKKYDAARDKLIMDALMKELGESDWRNMSERQRQGMIARTKLKERRLRKEGKYDEASALLGQLAENDKELQKKLGDSRMDQKRKLEERLARRKKLKEEREAKGLSTDETVLDAIQEEEDKKIEEEEDEQRKKKNILQELQNHYEDEKAALLASLRNQDDRYQAERKRQLELAKLKREQRRLAHEDKFDSAAILLNMAEQQDKQLEANYLSERERQKELARERLAARRKRREQTNMDQKSLEEALKKQHEEDQLKDAQDAQGTGTVQEAILAEVEKRHSTERDLLLELISDANSDDEAKQLADTLVGHNMKLQLEKLRQERAKWQQKSHQMALKVANGSQEEKDAHVSQSASGQAEQYKLLTKAMAIKLKAEREHMRETNPDIEEKDLQDEISVTLLSSLQQKQEAETSGLENMILEKEEEMLVEMKDAQRLAHREGFLNNLSNTVFSWSDASVSSQEEEARSQQVKKSQQEEFDKEKEELVEKLKRDAKPGEEVDVEAALAELQAQQDARKQALDAALERQRRMMKEKLEAKRQAREAQQYEQDAAFNMVKMAERRQSLVNKQSQAEKGRQQDLMQMRLAERRKARKRAAEEEKSESEGKMSMDEQSFSRPSTQESLPPGLGLKREKTALDVTISDEQKEQVYKQLYRQTTALHQKITLDQQRQQDLLEQRLRDRKARRQSEATALFSLGERQKTNLEKTRSEDRDRQLSMMKERVARVKYERTMTMKEKGAKSAKTFEDLVEDRETGQFMTEDERMEMAAKRMQEKFQQEEADVKQGKKSRQRSVSIPTISLSSFRPSWNRNKMALNDLGEDVNEEEEENLDASEQTPKTDLPAEEDKQNLPSRQLSEKDRIDKIKERRMRKKKERQQKQQGQGDEEPQEELV